MRSHRITNFWRLVGSDLIYLFWIGSGRIDLFNSGSDRIQVVFLTSDRIRINFFNFESDRIRIDYLHGQTFGFKEVNPSRRTPLICYFEIKHPTDISASFH